jgi:hypothetical protein
VQPQPVDEQDGVGAHERLLREWMMGLAWSSPW